MSGMGIDERQIRRAREGDTEALAAVAAHARRVAMQGLRRLLWSPQDREDIAQETVLRVMSHLGDLRDARALDEWVRSIARRVAMRRQRDDITLPIPELDEACPRPETHRRPGFAGELQAARARLSAARQQLLDMRYRWDLSYAEIAEHLQTTVPVVRRRLQGARDQLRKEMLRQMAQPNGDHRDLSYGDLMKLRAAALLADLDSDDPRERAVHIAGDLVLGGTTHRAALGRLDCSGLPTLVVDAEPLVRLDDTQARSACVGWDDAEVRVSLDDGSLLTSTRVDADSFLPGGAALEGWDLPSSLEVSHAELRELTEHIAAVSWGSPAADIHCGLVELAVAHSPGSTQLSASLCRPGAVTLLMSVQLGAALLSPPDAGDLTFGILVNRAYWRACVDALPPGAERARMGFRDNMAALRFSTPACPELWTLLMPISDREGWVEVEQRRRAEG